MNIYKAILRLEKKIWGDYPYVVLYFNKRPTNDQIIERLKTKIDYEIVDPDGVVLIEPILAKVIEYPIKDDSNYKAWFHYPKGMDHIKPSEGSTLIQEIKVTEI